MVALKAELGPFVPGVPGISGPSWDVFVAAGSDALPLTGTALGTFEHNSATDNQYTLNHAVIDHIRGILYGRQVSAPANTTPPSTGWVNPGNYPPPESQPKYTGPTPGSMFPAGFTDMSVIRMKRHGATMLSTSLTSTSVTMAVAATATIALVLQPGSVVGVNADHTFASNSDAIATVAATGVVTGKSPGNTFVRVTNKFNGLMVDVPVTVTAATLLAHETEGENQGEDVTGEDGKRNQKALPRTQLADDKEEKAHMTRTRNTDDNDSDNNDVKATKAKTREEADEKSAGDARLAKLSRKDKDNGDDDEDDKKKSKK